MNERSAQKCHHKQIKQINKHKLVISPICVMCKTNNATTTTSETTTDKNTNTDTDTTCQAAQFS